MSDYPQILCYPASLDGVPYLQLLQNFLTVAVDGIDADGEHAGNVLAHHSLIDQP